MVAEVARLRHAAGACDISTASSASNIPPDIPRNIVTYKRGKQPNHASSERRSWKFGVLVGVFGLLVIAAISSQRASTTGAHRSAETERDSLTHRFRVLRNHDPITIMINKHAKNAQQFVSDRRKAYEKRGRLAQFPFRGVGYLLKYHDMVLTAVAPESPKAGRNVVSIFDVNRYDREDCYMLTIWVRVSGPEIFSGSAAAVINPETDTCHWEFAFDLSVAGKYEVDARVLNWNGAALENDPNSMPIFENSHVPYERYKHHVSIKGFKLYDPSHSCCETCSRTSGCVYWSTPALHFKSNWGCELYFNNSFAMLPFQYYSEEIREEYIEAERRDKTVAHGPPHNKSTSYYMGCGWNFFLTGVSQCESSLDDAVHMEKNTFELDKKKTGRHFLHEHLPLCDLDRHEDKKGRWVREEYPDEAVCPSEIDNRKDIYGRLKHHDLLMFQKDEPHCWFRDDLSTLGARCFVDGCGTNRAHIWKSSLTQEKRWFGMWKNYECDYAEFTNQQLQQCFDRRKIVAMQTHGTSVAGYINEYLQQRLSHVDFYDYKKKMTPLVQTLNVTLDTFSSPHLMWHNSSAEWRKEFESYPEPREWEEHYFVETMYFVSEREPFCTAPRAEVINRDMDEVLIPKGYRRLSAFNMSSSFSYDTATQYDGMHLIGPPLRMIITKLFHYVCKDHIDTPAFASYRK